MIASWMTENTKAPQKCGAFFCPVCWGFQKTPLLQLSADRK
ncbi:hypothetical protein OHAE_3156 [Ochrobactrum soli]|uniref:Uncharacterized protein n=1 Tax=Ochrobactrum soli TaxID=2448455 RepID=A0A2P9HGJ4_9HYPH|nr:hypothetical protein OHAE_3156 [[Ochrobactrum] soli]